MPEGIVLIQQRKNEAHQKEKAFLMELNYEAACHYRRRLAEIEAFLTVRLIDQIQVHQVSILHKCVCVCPLIFQAL